MSELSKSFVHLSNIKTNPLIKEGFSFWNCPKKGFRFFPQGRGGKIGGLFLKGEGGYPVTYFYTANLIFCWDGCCALCFFTPYLSVFFVFQGKNLADPFRRDVWSHINTPAHAQVFKCVINHTGKWIFWQHVFPTWLPVFDQDMWLYPSQKN